MTVKIPTRRTATTPIVKKAYNPTQNFFDNSPVFTEDVSFDKYHGYVPALVSIDAF
jgi:hypothetical protein